VPHRGGGGRARRRPSRARRHPATRRRAPALSAGPGRHDQLGQDPRSGTMGMNVSTTPDSTRHVSLVPMTEEHLGEVLALEQRTYATPWSEQIFRDELAADNRIYLVAVDLEGRVVGYGGLMEVGEEAHITTVAVDPVHRGARIGTRLILELVSGAIER